MFIHFIFLCLFMTLISCGVNRAPVYSKTDSTTDTSSNSNTNSNSNSSTSPDSEDKIFTYSVPVGKTFKYNLPTTNAAGQNVVYQQSKTITGLVLDTQSWQFALTPTAAQVGYQVIEFLQINTNKNIKFTFNIEVTQSSNSNNSNSSSTTLITFSEIKPYQVLAGSFISFYVNASASDQNPVVISAVSLPQGSSFSNNRFQWTPTESDVGLKVIQFKAVSSVNNQVSAQIATQITVVSSVNTQIEENCVGNGQMFDGTNCVCKSEYMEFNASKGKVCILRSVVDTCQSQNRELNVDLGYCNTCKAGYFSQYIGYINGMPTFACVANQQPTCDSQNRYYLAASNSCGTCKPGFKVDTVAFRQGNYVCVLNLGF